MTRVIVFAVAVVFIGALAVLTVSDLVQNGFTGIGIVSLLVLVILGVGIIGAMMHPPPK